MVSHKNEKRESVGLKACQAVTDVNVKNIRLISQYDANKQTTLNKYKIKYWNTDRGGGSWVCKLAAELQLHKDHSYC